MSINSTIIRYPKDFRPDVEMMDDVTNFYWLTRSAHTGAKRVQLEKGINPIAQVNGPSGSRRPAVLIASSPHRFGSKETPWQDIYDPDNGWALYFGDNKTPGTAPQDVQGNKALLDEYTLYSSPVAADRMRAAPLLFFKNVTWNKRRKGFKRFQGFGVIERVSLVAQLTQDGVPFSNYCYECALFSLTKEDEVFSWDWIDARRNPALTDEESLLLAPAAWKRWVKGGSDVVARCRRSVAASSVIPIESQRSKDPAIQQALRTIYHYYENKKHNFEGLAATVVAKLLGEGAGRYKRGWVTRKSGDNGVDFVGRLDFGHGLSRVSVVVLGQAKCEPPTKTTGGIGLARTVARLKRGWIGAHVTTGLFSEHVQREVIEDQYPLLLVNGTKLATEALTMAAERRVTLIEFLEHLDELYPQQIEARRPEEIMTIELMAEETDVSNA